MGLAWAVSRWGMGTKSRGMSSIRWIIGTAPDHLVAYALNICRSGFESYRCKLQAQTR